MASPFVKCSETTPNDSDLILLSPQHLGEMMSKIVQLKVGNIRENYDQKRMKILRTRGVICSEDLKKCLSISDSSDIFDNLVHILESYCLIYKLNDKILSLLLKNEVLAADVFLVPCSLPPMKELVTFPAKCFEFQFEFESYLPNEVYLHVICKFLELVDNESTKTEIELTDSCCKFTFIKFDNDEFLSD